MGKLEDLMRRRQQRQEKNENGKHVEFDDEYGALVPTLYGLLAMNRFEDKPRQTTTLIIFAEGGRLKYSLNDREAGFVGFGTLEGLEGALEAIEADLEADKVDWRPQKRTTR